MRGAILTTNQHHQIDTALIFFYWNFITKAITDLAVLTRITDFRNLLAQTFIFGWLVDAEILIVGSWSGSGACVCIYVCMCASVLLCMCGCVVQRCIINVKWHLTSIGWWSMAWSFERFIKQPSTRSALEIRFGFHLVDWEEISSHNSAIIVNTKWGLRDNF